MNKKIEICIYLFFTGLIFIITHLVKVTHLVNCEDRFLLISMRKYHVIIKVRVSKRFSAFKR